jgi:hypothetical protein
MCSWAICKGADREARAPQGERLSRLADRSVGSKPVSESFARTAEGLGRVHRNEESPVSKPSCGGAYPISKTSWRCSDQDDYWIRGYDGHTFGMAHRLSPATPLSNDNDFPRTRRNVGYLHSLRVLVFGDEDPIDRNAHGLHRLGEPHKHDPSLSVGRRCWIAHLYIRRTAGRKSDAKRETILVLGPPTHRLLVLPYQRIRARLKAL